MLTGRIRQEGETGSGWNVQGFCGWSRLPGSPVSFTRLFHSAAAASLAGMAKSPQ